MIRCEIFSNEKCINCNTVSSQMVHVGILNMCRVCFTKEFGFVSKIDLNSDNGRKYRDLLCKKLT